LLCAFVRWNGLRLLLPQLRAHREIERELRVITTTYTGSTERKALDALVEMGAKVKVFYETRSTRLHAKAWLFHRETGFSTAYIGSSNLTQWALVDGVEWNVRLSQVTTPDILEKFEATFNSYWEEPDFESYDPARDAERFDRAVASTFETDPIPLVTSLQAGTVSRATCRESDCGIEKFSFSKPMTCPDASFISTTSSPVSSQTYSRD